MRLEKFVERAATLSGAYGNFRTAPELVDAETIAAARCQLAHQTIELFIYFVYQQEETGIFRNLTGNSLIPSGVWTPWGASGKSKLTRGERTVVRSWLMLLKHTRRFPVFFYVAPSRRWAVDTFRYPTLEEALAWLNANRLDAKTWLTLHHSLTDRLQQ